MRKQSTIILGLLVALTTYNLPAEAQGTPSPAPATDASAVDPAAADAQPTTVAPTEGLMSRWLAMNTLSFSYRWRSQTDSDSTHLMDAGQERALIDGRVKLDAEDKYSVNFHISTGRNFLWAYSDSLGQGYQDLAVLGSNNWSKAQKLLATQARTLDPNGKAEYSRTSRGWEMYFRQLYFSAKPIKQLTFEYGGLGIERGLNTEITSYDEDGYLAGERLRVRDPKHLYVDQIAITYAYMGDYFDPNFFDRGGRLTQSNYHQFLADKKFGNRVKASADYTFQNRTDTIREAGVLRIPELMVLDSARVELYQRVNSIKIQGENFQRGNGFAISGAKKINKMFELDGGYASVDQYYTALAGSRFLDSRSFSYNGDSYGLGNRLFVRADCRIDPYLTLFGFYTHEVPNTSYYTRSQQGMNFGMMVDFKNLLNNKFKLGIAPSTANN